MQGVCGPAGGVVSQTLENILASHTRLHLSSQTLQQELGGQEQELAILKKDRSELNEVYKHGGIGRRSSGKCVPVPTGVSSMKCLDCKCQQVFLTVNLIIMCAFIMKVKISSLDFK